MKTHIATCIQVNSNQEALQVKKAFATMHEHFGAKGIIKMEQLFLKDAFIRNLVKMKIN